MKKIIKKTIIFLIIFMLLFSNIGIVLDYGIIYATNLSNTRSNKEIEFDSYFADNVHEVVYNINSDNLVLYISININNQGYLKSGTISFTNENFDIVTENYKNEFIEKIDNNTITLKQIYNGTNIILEIPINIKNQDLINSDIFSREFETKLDAIYVNGMAEEVQISETVKNKLTWHGDANINTQVNIQKYTPFNSKSNYGVLLQIKVNTNIVDNKLPVNSLNLKIESPIVNNKKPDNVKVVANHTLGTNGQNDGINFDEQNWSYDINSGTVDINVSNALNANNEIIWKKNVDDEYLISFIYNGKDVYDFVNEKGFHSKVKAVTNINAYNDIDTKLQENVVEGDINIDEKVSDIVSFNLILEDKELNKGQIYSNYDAKNKREIEYNLQYIADIGYADILEYIEFLQNDYDKFITDDNREVLTTISENNYTKNKEIIISVDLFNKILGQDGYIDIFNEKDENIGRIDKNTEVQDNVYRFNLSEIDNNKIKLRTSKPIEEGQLKINIVKVINQEQDYSKNQMQTFSKLRTSIIGNTDLIEDTKTGEITLAEPVSKADIQLITASGTPNLSTTVENKNLELRVTLDTSSNSNALFKNPTLEIKLPKVLENIVFNDVKLTNANGLTIKSTNMRTEDNCKIIVIELEGAQTEYTIGDPLKGTNIIINFEAILDKLSTSMQEQILLTYTNENSTLFEQTTIDGKKGMSTTNVNVIAPTGVIMASGMKGYSNDEEVFTIDNEAITKKIEVNGDKKVLTISGNIVNNYENEIANVKILGRLPFEGNKVIDEQGNLGTTFNAKLLQNINISGLDANNVEVYYSTNAEATSDEGNKSNEWTKTPSSLNNIKSYMILVKNNMTKGASLNFSYNIEIPENLNFNNSAYTMYKIYYDNMSEIGNLKETKTSAILGITTGTGPELNVSLKSNFQENAEIQEGRIIKFTATITNKGEAEAKAVKLNIPVPEGMQFVTMNVGSGTYEADSNNAGESEKIFNLGNIKSGETVTKTYELRAKSDDEGVKDGNKIEINHQVGITEARMSTPILSNNYKFYKVNGDIQIEIVPRRAINSVLQKGDIVEFWVNFKNINKEDINNAKIQISIPKGINIKEAHIEKNGEKIQQTININDSSIQVIFATLPQSEMYNLVFEIEIGDYVGELNTVCEAIGDGIITNYSNEVNYTVNKMDVSIVQSSDSPEYIREGEEIVYTYTIKNNGNKAVSKLEFSNTVPDGLRFVKVESGLKNDKTNINTSYGLSTIKEYIYYLEPGQEYIITLTLKADIITDGKTKKVENFAMLGLGEVSEIESNKIVNYIEYNSSQHGGNPNNDRYIITGIAWNDSNKNGKREEEEELLPNIEVILINKSNNSIVIDSDTNQEKKDITDENGVYRFDNLLVGEYAVIFLFDTSKYSITEYRKKDVKDNLNSDALSINLTYNNTLRRAGITDTLKISNSNIRNIDIGLYEAEIFDLSIKKYVKQITLTTPTIGTKVYEHNNDIAKVEVLAQNLGKSNIVVEYKIVVKNEGNVPGYAKKVVDYLPKTLKFYAELNKDWYQNKDGNLYNYSLAETEIQPGEEKELKLILTKAVTEESLGIINNTAEIYESYNEQGLQDIDSTPGNKLVNEDDTASADLIILLVTGKATFYIFIVITVLTILIIGIYFIKIKVLNINKRKGGR